MVYALPVRSTLQVAVVLRSPFCSLLRWRLDKHYRTADKYIIRKQLKFIGAVGQRESWGHLHDKIYESEPVRCGCFAHLNAAQFLVLLKVDDVNPKIVFSFRIGQSRIYTEGRRREWYVRRMHRIEQTDKGLFPRCRVCDHLIAEQQGKDGRDRGVCHSGTKHYLSSAEVSTMEHHLRLGPGAASSKCQASIRLGYLPLRVQVHRLERRPSAATGNNYAGLPCTRSGASLGSTCRQTRFLGLWMASQLRMTSATVSGRTSPRLDGRTGEKTKKVPQGLKPATILSSFMQG
jgi:hypothetical protein